jgi:hypothetical protein
MEYAGSELSTITAEIRDIKNQSPYGTVPNAPFKSSKAWSMLAFKHILRHAAENGYERVTWDTGTTQVDRYEEDLRQKVDEIHYERGEEEGTWILEAIKDGDIVVEQTGLTDAEVEELVGKDIFGKMKEGTGEKVENLPLRPDVKAIKGKDLTIGGEGMKGFYDQILPAAVNKYVKQWGSKVEPSAIDTGKVFVGQFTTGSPRKWFVRISKTGENLGKFNSREEAQEFADTYGTPVHSVKITTSMRESVQIEGQPLFRNRNAGSDALIERLRTVEATQEVYENASGGTIHPNGEIEINEHDAEIIRRLQQARQKTSEASFDGMVLSPQNIDGIVKYGRGKGREQLKKIGATDEFLQNYDQLLDTLEEAKQNLDGEHIVAYVFESALPHERIHKEDLDAGRVTEEGIKQLKQSPLWEGTPEFNEAYGEVDDADRASELVAALGSGEDVTLWGFDKIPNFEQEKQKFLSTWAQDIADNNEAAIERMGEEAWAKKFAFIATHAAVGTRQTNETQKSDSGTGKEDRDTKDAGVVSPDGRQKGRETGEGKEGEGTAADVAEAPTAGEVQTEPVQTETGRGTASGSSTKGVSLHYQKVKEQFEDLLGEQKYTKMQINEQFDLAMDFVPKNMARAMRVVYGMEEPPGRLKPTAVALAVAHSLRAAGKMEQAQVVARRASSMLTEAAQTLNLAKLDLTLDNKVIANIENGRLRAIGEKMKQVKGKSPLALGRENQAKKAGLAADAVNAEMNRITKNVNDILERLTCK